MLTARRAFGGEDVTETLAAVVRADPDWASLPPETPPSIRRLLRRCLVKDPKSRLTDIGIARFEIDDARELDESVAGTPDPTARPRGRVVAIAGSFILGALITGLAIWALVPKPPPTPTVHLTIPLPDDVSLANTPGALVAVSPDAAYVAYMAGAGAPWQVFLRPLDAETTSPVAESTGATNPFFSPDGRQIGFTRNRKIWRALVSGGATFEVGPLDTRNSTGTTWAEDGYIHSGGTTGLSRVLASGGARESLTTVDAASGELGHRTPSAVPGREAIVFTVFKGPLDEARVGVLDLRTREWRVLLDRPGHHPRVTRSGRLFFVHRGALLAVAFDPKTLTVAGEPQALVNGVSDRLPEPNDRGLRSHAVQESETDPAGQRSTDFSRRSMAGVHGTWCQRE